MNMTLDPGGLEGGNRTNLGVPTLTRSPPSIQCSITITTTTTITPNLTLVAESKRLKLSGAQGLEAAVQVVDLHITEREALEWVETQEGKT